MDTVFVLQNILSLLNFEPIGGHGRIRTAA